MPSVVKLYIVLVTGVTSSTLGGCCVRIAPSEAVKCALTFLKQKRLKNKCLNQQIFYSQTSIRSAPNSINMTMKYYDALKKFNGCWIICKGQVSPNLECKSYTSRKSSREQLRKIMVFR